MIENNLKKSNFAITVGVTLVLLALIGSLMHYNIEERKLMASNIDSAVEKGVDPLSVRCSYAKSDDIVCVTFASNSHRINNPVK